MPASYDISNDQGKVRLLIGDTDVSNAIFQDDEIQAFLDRQGNVTDAAADACEAAAAKFARKADFSIDGQLIKASQVARQFMNLARELRERGDNNVGTFGVERVDGYTENIANDSNERSSPRTGIYGAQPSGFEGGWVWP